MDPLPKEAEHQRGGKQEKGDQTLANKKAESQIGVPAWMPTLVLDRAPLPADASIKRFQDRRAGYVANAVEQALLLPEDMIEWQSMRKHKVFLSLKRELTLVSLLSIPFFFLFFFKGCPGCPQSQGNSD